MKCKERGNVKEKRKLKVNRKSEYILMSLLNSASKRHEGTAQQANYSVDEKSISPSNCTETCTSFAQLVARNRLLNLSRNAQNKTRASKSQLPQRNFALKTAKLITALNKKVIRTSPIESERAHKLPLPAHSPLPVTQRNGRHNSLRVQLLRRLHQTRLHPSQLARIHLALRHSLGPQRKCCNALLALGEV